MLDIMRKNGATSNVIRVKLRRSDTGQGLTGLTYSSSGLIISTICDNEASATTYTAGGSTIETITTLGTYAAPTATKCRFKEVDATNFPGYYELQLADARFAVSNAKVLRISIVGASNLLEKDIRVQLTSFDLDNATPAVNATKIGGTTQTAADLGVMAPGSTDVTTAITFAVVDTCYAGSTTGINVTTSTANSTGADYGFANVVSLSAGSPPVLTDNKGNKWEVIEVVTEGWVEMITYECKNPRVGTGHTLTATSDGKSPAVFAAFMSGVRRSGTHTDQASSAHTFTGTSQAPGSITPSENNCIVLSAFLCGGSGSISVGESYTKNSLQMNASGAHIGGGLAYKIQTTATSTNPTWTQAGSGSIGAAIYSFFPNVAGTKYITLDQTPDKQVMQREQNTTQKLVSVSGKYYGQAPTTVEVQAYKWRASGSVGLLHQDWTPVTGLVASSGSWSGKVSIPQGGWLRCRARSKDANGAVLATGMYANNRWGVGINVAVIGQSNGYKLFQDFGLGASDDDLTSMFTAGVWADVTGDGATALANAVSSETGLPVGVWNYAVSGAGLVYDAGSGDWSSQVGGKPWPLFQTGISAGGGDLEYIVWQGCEADAENSSYDADALKAAFDTLYGRILVETPRTAATLPFIVSIPGPLDDDFTTDARWDSIRRTAIEWADETTGGIVGGSLADSTLIDDYHFGGVAYDHNGRRLAQTILYHNGLADNSGRSPQIFKAWRFSGSPIVYVQLIGLGNSGICEADGTTDGGSLTGFQVSDDAWSTTETISSTAIEGNIIKLTLAATPTDGATVVVRSSYGKTPTITNLPYRKAFPQGDTVGLPIAPSGEVSVELRTAFDADTDTASQATLAKEYPIDFGYTRKTANGAVAAARATSNITLLSETETTATVSSYTTQSSGALVWDNGVLTDADKLQLAGSGGSGSADTRDLEPVQFTWEISRRSDGTLVSTNTLRIAPNETIRAGFNCNRQIVLPTGAVLATMSTPTSTLATITPTKLGIDPTNAKVSLDADSAAVGGTTGYVRVTVTNSNGAGPVTLLGKVEVVAEP